MQTKKIILWIIVGWAIGLILPPQALLGMFQGRPQ